MRYVFASTPRLKKFREHRGALLTNKAFVSVLLMRTRIPCLVPRLCLNVNTGPLVVFQVSRQMPARLFQNEILTMHLKTVNNDWRLDEYEARNVGFWMDLQVFPDLLLPILSYCAFLQLTCANTIADVCNQEYSGPPSCHGYWDGCRFLRFDQQRFHKSRELAKQTILGSNLYQHGGQGVRIWANGKCFRGAAVPSLERKGHRPDGLLEV